MKLKKLQDRARELEAQIAALEAEIASDEESLANFVSAEETMRAFDATGKAPRRVERAALGVGRDIARSMSDFQEQLAHLRKRIARIDKKYTLRSASHQPLTTNRWPSPKTGCTAKRFKRRTASTTKPKDSTNASGRHGSIGIVDLEDMPHDLLDPISNGQIRGVPPAKWCFLDTETTGLAGGSGTYAFLIGVGRITPQGFRVRQFFMRDFGEEASQLSALTEHLKQFEVLITYNGRTFDQPLLETRYRMVAPASAVQRTGASRSAVRRAPAVEFAVRQLPPGGSGEPDSGSRAARRSSRRIDSVCLFRIRADARNLSLDAGVSITTPSTS